MNSLPRIGVWQLAVVGLIALCAPASVHAARPMPPLLTSLLEIFPEERGWFVDGPLGSAADTPEDARKFFDQPRVLVPNLDALPIAVGKLFAASGKLPIKKITRHDEKPGADGLPGFRGIWCATEDESLAGFSILTPNQNRFLMWAKAEYYPSFAIDSIEGKVRDWYARSVSDYLASVDYNVPDNQVPLAAERNLPAWMELYPAAPQLVISSDAKLSEFMAVNTEIKIWGWGGLTAFIPSRSAIDSFITSAPDTLWTDKNAVLIQDAYHRFLLAGGTSDAVNALTPSGFDTLSAGSYIFAVDPYGRIRVARHQGQPADGSPEAAPAATLLVSHAMLFQGTGVLTAGTLELTRTGDRPQIKLINTRAGDYFYSRISPSIRDDVSHNSESYLLSLGHLFASLKSMDIALDSVLIRKF